MTWAKGDPLTAVNLNSKTRDIVNDGGRFYGGQGLKAQSGNPDLIFRQENTDMPSNGETFPYFHARRPFRIVGVKGYVSAGTFNVTLRRTNNLVTNEVLLSYTDADIPNIKYLTVATDGFIAEDANVNLLVNTSSGVENFQLNVLIRLLG